MTKSASVITITPQEYLEFQELRRLYNIDSKIISARQMETLEADIDAPIRLVVGALVLLGCQPVWSCCGFDYAGQPHHKSHEYGKCYVVMMHGDRSDWLAEIMEPVKAWQFTAFERFDERLCQVVADIKSKNSWTDPQSVHNSEVGAIALTVLKSRLFTYKDLFADQVTLKDSNAAYKARFPDWQYPSLYDWVINKADIIEGLERELAYYA